jgi:hypothetical protein
MTIELYTRNPVTGDLCFHLGGPWQMVPRSDGVTVTFDEYARVAHLAGLLPAAVDDSALFNKVWWKVRAFRRCLCHGFCTQHQVIGCALIAPGSCPLPWTTQRCSTRSGGR